MVQYNYPTIILLGQGALAEFVNRLKAASHKKILIVTDPMVEKLGIVKKLTDLLAPAGIAYAVFTDVNPNPIEDDVEKGVAAYKTGGCDSIIGLGGGSPVDVAKVIKIMVSNPPPLAQYDDSLGGDRLITQPMPPLYAISTTSGTGSEVGRSGVIIMRDTKRKTIFFHPQLLPSIAVLEPGADRRYAALAHRGDRDGRFRALPGGLFCEHVPSHGGRDRPAGDRAYSQVAPRSLP